MTGDFNFRRIMRYEIYSQDPDEKVSKQVQRFFTENKKTAFYFMNEKNKIAGRNIWRVAMCISDRICFDIDFKDGDNLRDIYKYYSVLFETEFKIYETLNGYHLISIYKYKDNLRWQYDTCRVLYPILKMEQMQYYIESLVNKAKKILKNQAELNLGKDKFLDKYNEDILYSGLFCGKGTFDLYFCTNVIVRGHYCIRISKKSKEDTPKEIKL